MSRIKILPEILANKIAAGEVVERPASVVKELAENSLDAGATKIFIEVQSGGSRLIKVSDDGTGMSPDDALLALERHATSKISKDSDLNAIRTLGFRGEAVPSIASVSRMRITTSTGDGPGALVVIEGGKLLASKEAGAPKGTVVEVRDLFFNTPARLKFLKSRETEFGHIAAAVEKMALAHPAVHFRLVHDGRESLDVPPVKRHIERVAQVYGTDFADRLVTILHSTEGASVEGFVSAPGTTFSDKGRQEIFLNSRPIKNNIITRALYDALQSIIMKDRHPACLLFLSIDPADVDVNVHPQKREVRFADGGRMHRLVYEAVIGALRQPETEDAATDDGHRIQRVREATEAYVSRTDTHPSAYFPTREPHQEAFSLPRPVYRPAQHDTDRTAEPEPHHRRNLMQVADSYIVVPEADGYLLIDQHAAHERIQYERVKAAHANKTGSQGLLVPERLDLTPREAAVMEGIITELNEAGIEVEAFGGGSYLIRSKPLFMEKADVKEVVIGVLSEISEAGGAKGKVEEVRERVYQMIACKAAVKAGRRLHPEAMERLVTQLFSCEMPYTCAHGRPTVVKYSLTEIEKLFKRK